MGWNATHAFGTCTILFYARPGVFPVGDHPTSAPAFPLRRGKVMFNQLLKGVEKDGVYRTVVVFNGPPLTNEFELLIDETTKTIVNEAFTQWDPLFPEFSETKDSVFVCRVAKREEEKKRKTKE
ncbi:hypothetical protein CEXT_257891 [Caerostris extrusa]|uniref:Uncharacterized protein n=1 Tax=Caerostris extrusa TaxID=172846 RepID=A0AAV4TQQ4_CAEEX|nr:hypothetical protein CEXT_257891 [Caerostris extrusa]